MKLDRLSVPQSTDGLWHYEWNGENRLIGMRSVEALSAKDRVRKQFVYDYQGRRVRAVTTRSAGNVEDALVEEQTWMYDRWSPVVETRNGGFHRAMVWGIDLSGSEQGAGGVGGLLAVEWLGGEEGNRPDWTYHYDGNGNVSQVYGDDQEVVASYQYTPFGQVLWAEGIAAFENDWRFSTKLEDGDAGMLYYGVRYYMPEMGRWLNRDPIEEEGGLNLYGFLGNDGIGSIDYLGFWKNYSSQDWTMTNAKVCKTKANDTLSGLAELITGDGSHASLVSFQKDASGKEYVDVVPLLNQFEEDLNDQIAMTAKRQGGKKKGDKTKMRFRSYPREQFPKNYKLTATNACNSGVDCRLGAGLMLASGFRSYVGSSVYEKLVSNYGFYIPDISPLGGNITPQKYMIAETESAEKGHVAYFLNYSNTGKDMRGWAWIGEYATKIDDDLYFAHPLGNWSSNEILSFLKSAYYEKFGNPPASATPPHLVDYRARYEYAYTAMKVFYARKSLKSGK